MKKIFPAIPIVLCAVFGIVPLLEFIDIFVKAEFHLFSELAVVIIQALLAIASMVLFIVFKPDFRLLGAGHQLFASMSLPIAMLNALCFVLNGLSYTWIFAAVWCVCIFIIYLKFLPDSTQRAACAVASVLLIFIIAGSMIWSVVSHFVFKHDVLRTLPSNDETYIAEIGTKNSIFGKKTLVEVSKSKPKVWLLVGGFYDKPIAIYEGEGHIAKIAKISWYEDSENVLVINGTAYEVKFDQ